ncbi:ribonuclease HI family protein [Bryocella elongata]|nr:ribonuclease HI family protein [Bryocella elongata]
MSGSTPSLFASSAKSSSSSSSPGGASSGWVTANTDGGARGNPGPAGYGVVVEAENGERLAELSEFIGVKTNNVAEYSALLAALEWAEANGHSKLRVISDSELMVRQIQGKYKVNSPDLKPMWEDARRRIGKLDRFEIQHALRHKNKVADGLANRAMDKAMGRNPEGPASSPRPAAPARSVSSSGTAAAPAAASRPAASPSRSAPPPQPGKPTMLRGFVRDGVVHLLGGATLPNGIFVKVIPEE